MMRFLWLSPKNADNDHKENGGAQKARRALSYASTVTLPSTFHGGVRFTIRRISLGMKMELMQQIREVSRKIEFLASGDELQERIEANLLAHQIDATYLRWGLSKVEGLKIDGDEPTADLLIEKGPEGLTKEIVIAIKSECGLSEEERKN